jgi:hypothetical protein
MAAWSMTAAEIQEFVRPPLPQIKLFPPRFGYTEHEIGIEDLINLPRNVATTQLVESDFSQTNDSVLSPAKKAEWATYRQALRDVTAQSGFPYEINWPVKPS